MPSASIAIFVEGASYTDLRGRVPLVELWRELSTRIAPDCPPLHVFGINKAQIVALGETPKTPGSREPLDVLIERMYRKHGFDVVMIAFDRIPSNQLVPHDCLRAEVNFILERFVARKLMAPFLVDAARALLNHYQRRPKQPRGRGRPPREALDILYMDPMFEALLVADDSAVLKAVGLKRRPPRTGHHSMLRAGHPDVNILAHAIGLASPTVRGVVRGDMKSKKHDWALRIIRDAKTDSRIFQHPIAQRLATLLA